MDRALGEGVNKKKRPWRIRWLFRIWGLPLEEASRELESIEAMSAEAQRKWQRDRAWEMARYHYQHNTWYRQRVGPRFPDRWEDLPILKRQDFQAPLAQRQTPYKGTLYHGSTSGSSGHPMRFCKDMYAHAMTWALLESRYRELGLSWTDKQARFYGMPRSGTQVLIEKVKDGCLHRRRFPVHDLGDKTMSHWWDQLQKGSLDYLYGYTSVLAHFAQWIRNHIGKENLGLPQLKQVILTSETCSEEDRLEIRQAFGMDPIREYGVSELCLLGFDRKGRFDLNHETLLIEKEDDKGGDFGSSNYGQVTATSLFNRAYPLVRYQPGDLVVLGEEAARSYIEEIKGRVTDMIHLPNGGRAAGLNFYYLAKEMLLAHYPVKQFRVRQTQIDLFEIDYIGTRALTGQQEEQMKEWVSKILGHPWRIQFHHLDHIPPHPLGKRQHFYCEIPSH